MARQIHVLLVDDEASFVEPVAFWLSSRGYRVTTASSGSEALVKIAPEPPDIVFLDIKMPGLDGIQTLERIRRIHKKLPVIIMTAAYEEQHVAAANQLGVSGFFPKHGDLANLTRFIEGNIKAHATLKPPPRA